MRGGKMGNKGVDKTAWQKTLNLAALIAATKFDEAVKAYKVQEYGMYATIANCLFAKAFAELRRDEEFVEIVKLTLSSDILLASTEDHEYCKAYIGILSYKYGYRDLLVSNKIRFDPIKIRKEKVSPAIRNMLFFEFR